MHWSIKDTTVHHLPIDGLVMDPELSPRYLKNAGVVRSSYLGDSDLGMHALVSNFDELPPIVVNIDHYVVDGWHRIQAAKTLGRDKIRCYIIDEVDEVMLFRIAVSMNTRHGFALTYWERRDALFKMWEDGERDMKVLCSAVGIGRASAYKMLEDKRNVEQAKLRFSVLSLNRQGKTQKEIAEETGVSQSTVSRLLKEMKDTEEKEIKEREEEETQIRMDNVEDYDDGAADPDDAADADESVDDSPIKSDFLKDIETSGVSVAEVELRLRNRRMVENCAFTLGKMLCEIPFQSAYHDDLLRWEKLNPAEHTVIDGDELLWRRLIAFSAWLLSSEMFVESHILKHLPGSDGWRLFKLDGHSGDAS